VQYVGIALLIVCAGLLLWRRSRQARLAAILATETSTVKELTELGAYVREGLDGHTGFSRACEVKGIVRCDNPITSEVAKQPCVYYSMTVTREYEEQYTETDKDGNRHQRTKQSSDTVANNSQRVPFWVEDETGRILVDPQGAEVDAVQVVDRYEPAAQLQLGLNIGGLNINLGEGGVGNRTLGYRYSEHLLAPDKQVFVLGEASDSSGTLQIQKPQKKGGKFIISLKSEEQLVAGAKQTINWLLYGGIASGAVGVVLVVLGLVRR
jgi:hypothetical protein